MDTASVGNLLSYSAQILCIVALGAAVPAVLRLDAADVRYAYWRGLAVLCLVLPWIQARVVRPATAVATEETFRAADIFAQGTVAPAARGRSWQP